MQVQGMPTLRSNNDGSTFQMIEQKVKDSLFENAETSFSQVTKDLIELKSEMKPAWVQVHLSRS